MFTDRGISIGREAQSCMFWGQVGSQRPLLGSWSDAPGGTGGEETSFLGHHDPGFLFRCRLDPDIKLGRGLGWKRNALEPNYLEV